MMLPPLPDHIARLSASKGETATLFDRLASGKQVSLKIEIERFARLHSGQS